MMNEQYLTPEQKWEQATLANNFIFYKVMRHHPDACKHLLEMLLGITIENMTIANEAVLDIDHDAKSIRLDVYVKETGRVYDIEIQIANTRELPERARFYSSAIDLDCLAKGKDFKDLPECHIIFICMDDIFEEGLPIYTFENICCEDERTKLNDRTYKHFFIAPLCAKMSEDKEVRSFFAFLISNKAQTGYTADLSRYVADAKHNTQWRMQYMTVATLERYAREDGFADGMQQKAIEDARKLLADGKYTAQEIAVLLQIPVESFADNLKRKISESSN